MKVSIYADGSSTGRSNKPGGWAYVIVDIATDMPLLVGYGGCISATNNTMELTAAIKGLKAAIALGYNLGDVELVSDSKYTLGMASGQYSPSTNLELAAEIKFLAKGVWRLRWVKGHSGHPWQERCDTLSRRGRMENTSTPPS